jgi:hypothetical protein
MLPIAKKSAVRSTLLLGASALTLGVGANLVMPRDAEAACTFVANPLATGTVTTLHPRA